MEFRDHLHTTGSALKRWFIAQSQDALAVGLMWLVGLLIIRVPLAPVWAVIGGALQFIPNFGPVIALIGPAACAALFMEGWEPIVYVLILYGIIAVVDGLVLQPYLMRRTAKVPIWASILAPIILGLLFSFWGVLIAAPLLAIIYAYRHRNRPGSSPAPPPAPPRPL